MNIVEYQDLLEDKSNIHLTSDLFSLTAVCFMKVSEEKYLLNVKKRAELLYSCIWMIIIQLALIGAIYYAITTNENNDYQNKFAHSIMLFVVKFPCAIALHLMLYEEI